MFVTSLIALLLGEAIAIRIQWASKRPQLVARIIWVSTTGGWVFLISVERESAAFALTLTGFLVAVALLIWTEVRHGRTATAEPQGPLSRSGSSDWPR